MTEAPKLAAVWGVFGASGTGKDAWVKQQLKRKPPPRLIVWDAMDEYAEFAQLVDKPEAMLDHVRAARFAVRYVAKGDKKANDADFEKVCRIAWAAERLTFVANELSRVTSPSHAPWAWSQLTTAGRHRRIHVIGLSQFPAQVDKSLLGNATLLHCGHLANVRHRQAVAVEMDIDPEVIRALPNLHFVEWSRGAREVTHGALSFAATPRPSRRTSTGAAKPGR